MQQPFQTHQLRSTPNLAQIPCRPQQPNLVRQAALPLLALAPGADQVDAPDCLGQDVAGDGEQDGE